MNIGEPEKRKSFIESYVLKIFKTKSSDKDKTCDDSNLPSCAVNAEQKSLQENEPKNDNPNKNKNDTQNDEDSIENAIAFADSLKNK